MISPCHSCRIPDATPPGDEVQAMQNLLPAYREAMRHLNALV